MFDLVGLGRRVHELRTERGLTLQELADRSAVSLSMLSSVERGAKAATVVVLDRIARGLGTEVTDLLGGGAPDRVVLRRADEQEAVAEPGGWQRTILSPVVPGVNFEWIRSSLPAGCDAGAFPAYAAGSHEFVVVERGELDLDVDGEVFRLAAGDSLYFAADVPHGYANRGESVCEYHVAALIMRPRGPGTARKR